MPSPRRSARSTLPPSTNPLSSHSSSTSLSSAQRNTRSNQKPSGSPLSSEDGDTAGQAQPPPTRSSRRSKHPDDDTQEDVGETGEVAEGADITRCVCGHQDYPGPPLTEDTRARADISEETGGLFIQCDICSVWQHGGCVGILDEDKTPDDYFCELCNKKLHQVRTDPRGQRYSRYLPVVQVEEKPIRKPSISRENDVKFKKEREGISRASVEELLPPKRRSTMNSRQTYDEEEMLRKAIEESREEKEPGTSSRKGKRSRDESEEDQQGIKRQRRASDSVDANSTLVSGSLDLDLDGDSDDDGAPSSKSALKKARAQAAEVVREKERKELEKSRQSQRLEAAKGRQARAGRRRGDESEALEETPKPESAPIPPTSQPLSPPAIELNPPSSSHKKGGKKAKRLGRNQYSKDRENMSPTRKATNTSNSSGEETKPTSGEASVSKPSPPISQQEVVPPAKGKGRWKGKASRTATTNDNDSKKDKPQITLKEMERGTQYMLEWLNKNLPEQRIVEGTSMLRNTSTPMQQQHPSQGFGVDKPEDQMTVHERGDQLRHGIAEWHRRFLTPNPGGLTVSST